MQTTMNFFRLPSGLLYYSQTPLLRTPLGPEKVSILRGVLIKRVNFKENVLSGTKVSCVK